MSRIYFKVLKWKLNCKQWERFSNIMILLPIIVSFIIVGIGILLQ